ncbi:DgyrCDS13351 [Dimorphilus gyrociliatus]|uniref:DgyrCDS13351 n=1 Tax=Dimorphilus gyrociliatus TaxID=2664684 RepID=A0A7I8WAI0_9ANNE|nr:DgyrCDS13351 [Dimorphilus gyrociliatus]
MGAFNTRRKLKGAVLAAVSSAKWKKEGEEECLVDFQDDDVTSAAVSLILDSLEEIQCLTEDDERHAHFVDSVLQDRKLYALLQVCTIEFNMI